MNSLVEPGVPAELQLLSQIVNVLSIENSTDFQRHGQMLSNDSAKSTGWKQCGSKENWQLANKTPKLRVRGHGS